MLTSKGKLFIRILAAALPALILVAVLNFLAAKDLPRLMEGGQILSTEFVPSSDPALRWTWTPNLNHYYHEHFGVFITTNAEGFRTKPFLPKGGLPRIVILGDSISFGICLDEANNLSGRLETLLAEKGVEAEVFNLGIPAYSMGQYAASYRLFGAGLGPDFVILQSKPRSFLETRVVMMKPWMERVPLAAWLFWRYQRTLTAPDTREAGIAEFSRLVRSCREAEEQLVVLYFPFLVANATDDAWKVDKTSFENAGAPVVDVAEILTRENRDLTQFRVRPDDIIHPNARAVDLVARRVAAMAEEKIKRP